MEGLAVNLRGGEDLGFGEVFAERSEQSQERVALLAVHVNVSWFMSQDSVLMLP